MEGPRLESDHDYIIDMHRRIIQVEKSFSSLPCTEDSRRLENLESWRDQIIGAAKLVGKVSGVTGLAAGLVAIYKSFF